MLNKKYLKSSRYLSQGINHKVVGLSQAYTNQFSKFSFQTRLLNKPLSAQESFLNGTSSVYAEQMYDQWKQDPSSVHASWRSYFENIERGAETPFELPPTVGQDPTVQKILNILQQGGGLAGAQGAQRPAIDSTRQVYEAYKIMMLIRAFMTHGHLIADLDPLQLYQSYKQFPSYAQKFKFPEEALVALVDYHSYGFTDADLDREFVVEAHELGGILSKKKNWKLRDLIEAYKTAYCGKIGVEYMHIADRREVHWIRDKIEGLQYEQVPKEERVLHYDRLLWADMFGNFLANKFNTMKRFGLEGCESFIPGLKASFDVLVESGVEKVIIGMPHRGRLNVLGNVVRKPLEQIFNEFQGKIPDGQEVDYFTGDVKYHLGTSYTKKYPSGKYLTTTVLANPSHLETVDPVVVGRARAEQNLLGDTNSDKVVPIIIHGDAAFAGQGVVYETIQMTNLANYGVGGTIHVVVNNQIGFTTIPSKARSGVYCTDLAKAIDAPIFHVNADSMEDVRRVFQIAAEYRQKFKNDVVIDLIGYRRHGHNELDAPDFTQPLMYKRVRQMKSVAQKYEEQLISEGILTKEESEKMKAHILAQLNKAYEESKTHKFTIEEWKTDQWEQVKQPNNTADFRTTGVMLDTLKEIGEKITTLPKDWDFHPNVKKIYEHRHKSIVEGKGIDWGTAEALAFGSLINEGYRVRISGQDVERGTFSHRHAVVFDQNKDRNYTPLSTLLPNTDQQRFQVCNSHLSEYAVLGYEYGYAITQPNCLTLWEAQFGDFSNGAQIIIDTMIAAGEAKWNVKNGLVMLLPHGYDGQGPEHSSCRIERYLQLCDESAEVPNLNDETTAKRQERINMQVCNITSSANYFHMLRRQIRRQFRKPMVLASPKKLLKLRDANSDIHEFAEGLQFQKIITDQNPNLVAADKVKKVILCSGQVYFDLANARQKENRNEIAIIRVEQLCPFPFEMIIPELKKYKNAQLMWAQEEPENQGGFSFVMPRLQNILKSLDRKVEVHYAGRKPAAATSTGYGKIHEQELKSLLQEAMKL